MSSIDWIVMVATLAFIVAYGMWKSRNNKNMDAYLRGSHSLPWYAVGISIMATQASAITFLSAPGQSYADGMRFVQSYFGMPLAMIILCISALPVYHRLNIYTAYEYLESRFDRKTRSLASFLFLIQRGLSTGITIYAPGLVLSCILGWNIYITNLVVGGIVILYTVSGGSRAVGYTQLGQMTVVLGGMFFAGIMVVYLLPENVSFMDAIKIAGRTGKMNLVDFSFDVNNKYNFWSGIIGGFFLSLSYFGTDQSQVGRYLSGRSLSDSRMGLLFNGFFKIPMQFFLLLIGVLLYVFFIFHPAPLHFNRVERDKIISSTYGMDYKKAEDKQLELFKEKKETADKLVNAIHENDKTNIALFSSELKEKNDEQSKIRNEANAILIKNDPLADLNDTNYVFLSFVTQYLPLGLIGLLIAVVLSASMSATSSAINGLASTTVIDIYKRSIKQKETEAHYVNASRWFTIGWGLICIVFAQFANRMGTLIEAVNILGSLFYGTILGIFLTAFYLKKIKGANAFYAALISEVIVILCYAYTNISFLWFNLIGCILVMAIATLLHYTFPKLSAK